MRVLFWQQVASEGPGRFGQLLRRWGIPFEVAQMWRGQPIPPLADYNALIVLGGPMNVYEEEAYSYLKEEDRAIQEAVARGLPYLGICLGSQLLAKALRARVWPNPVREIGHFQVELTEAGRADPIFEGLPWRPWVFQWHGDSFDLPSAAVHLASSPACDHQAFRFGPRAYGLQFHLETTPALVRRWAQDYHQELTEPPPGRDIALGPMEIGAEARQFRRAGERLLANFLRMIEGS